MTKIERRFVGRSVSSLARSLRTLAVVALGAGGLAVTARAQQPSASAQRVPCPRPADAPPLVPVRLDRDGNFRIAPPYVPDPAFTPEPNVPAGRVIRFTMNSAESKIFPTAPVPAPRAGGGVATPSRPTARGTITTDSFPTRNVNQSASGST